MLGADKDKSGPNMWVGAASLVERTMKTLFLGGITDDIDAKVTLSAGDRALLNGNLLTGFADMYGGGDINATKLFRYAETKLRSLGMPGIYPTMDPVLAAFASPEFPGMIADVIEQVQSCVAPPVSSYTCCGSTPLYNSVCSGYTQIGSSACRNVPVCRWSSTCSRRLATDGQVDAPSFDNDMQRYVKQMDGHAKRRLSSSPSPSNAPATPSPWSSSGTSGQSPSNAPATPSPWSSSGTSAPSPSKSQATPATSNGGGSSSPSTRPQCQFGGFMDFLGGSPKAFALKVAVAAKANELAALLRMPLFTDMKVMADEIPNWRMPSKVVGPSDHPLLVMMIKYVEK